jgi:hypothetical protein
MSKKLQAEIKQSRPFPRPSAEAFLSIVRTAAVLEHQIGEVLRPHGITSTQYNVLRILRGAGARGLCGREIAERLVSRVPDVSRLLDRMEELGLLTRERDPGGASKRSIRPRRIWRRWNPRASASWAPAAFSSS